MDKVSEYLEKMLPKAGIGLLMVLYFFTASWAASGEIRPACAPYEIPIELEFTTGVLEPIVHTTASAAEIASMVRAGGIEDPAHHPSGVTVVETRLALDSHSFAVHNRQTEAGASGECLYLDKVIASFGWRAHDIYVAANLTPGSCFYEAVLRHEQEHAAINDAVLRVFAPRVKAALEDALAREVPVFDASRGAAAKDVIARLDASTATVLAEFEREKAKRHAVIDSPERRLAQTRACVGVPPARKPRVQITPY